jgi:glycosyltransferase involved in cell wall biosynthesis
MLIGIDISMLVYQGSGVANYTYNLVKNLLLFDKKNTYKLFYSSFRRQKETKEKLQEFKKLGAKVYDYPFPPFLLKLFWNKLHLFPIEWFIGKVDVFHSSDFLRPPTSKTVKNITTIHDLTWKLFPEYHTNDVINRHEKKLQKTIKYGDEIIVVSQNTKKDLLKLYPQIKSNKVNVIYPGVGEHFKKIEDKKAIEKVINKYLKRYMLHVTCYMLYVGAIEPRKNLDLAIKVFHKLSTSNPQPATSNQQLATSLLVIGRAGWKNEKIFQLVKDLNLEDKVIFLGYVEDQDLPYFYSGAKLTFYLSSYEGFGLPPLESLACGTPVIAGNNSSMKETLPKEFLVDEKDEDEVYKKVLDILKLKNLPKLKKDFSWNNYIVDFLKKLTN